MAASGPWEKWYKEVKEEYLMLLKLTTKKISEQKKTKPKTFKPTNPKPRAVRRLRGPGAAADSNG